MRALSGAVAGLRDVAGPVRSLQGAVECSDPRRVEAQCAVFIDTLFDLDPAVVIAAAQRHRNRLKNPPMTVDAYLDVLLRQGLAQTTQALNGYRAIL